MKIRKTVAFSLVLAAVVLSLAIYFRYELWLANHIYWRSAGVEAALESRGWVRVIGHMEAPVGMEVFPYLDGGSVRHADTIHQDSGFVLTVRGSEATLGVVTGRKAKPVGLKLDDGYYMLTVKLVDAASDQESSIQVERISMFRYLSAMHEHYRPVL